MRGKQTMRLDKVDSEGVFRMTLATEGEASDGDILSIEGMQVSAQMPLLLSHFNDPTAVAGSVTQPEKELKASPPRLRATGQIEMGGTGHLAEIRRDVAMMINKHGGSVSIRWDELEGGKPPVRRMNLPSDHPHFVADDDPSWKKRNGFFWPSSKALEGSIVALGADSAATIGGRLYAERADQTEGALSDYWRAMTDDARQETRNQNDWRAAPGELDALRLIDAEPEGGEPTYEPVHIEPKQLLQRISPEMADDETFSQVAEQEGEVSDLERGLKDLCGFGEMVRARGGSSADIINAVTLESDGDDFELVTIGDEEVFLPQRLADQLADEREARAETKAQKPEPDPEPARKVADQRPAQTLGIESLPKELDARDVSELFKRMLDKHEANIIRRAHEMFDERTGKVKS